MEELRNSPRYIKTFAEYIKSGDDEEIRALLTENVSGTIPVPELVYDAVKTAWTRDGIMNLVRKSYLKGNLKVGFEISSDGAQIHSEGADRIDEEQLVLGVVNLIPSNIKKYIAISDEIYDLAPEEFLTYVYSELTYQIAKKCGEELVNRIVYLSTQSNVPVVDYIDSPVTVSTVAMALSKLCSEAENPVIVMNKASWGQFKKAQYENKFRVDPFEGLPVVFNNALKPFNSATTGETYAIVGDFGNGALANYPNGEDILVKTDDITLAQSDLIKIIGRQYVAVDVVAPNHFTVINKGDEVTPIVPTGNIEITENGENINVAPYATATVNVSGGGGSSIMITTFRPLVTITDFTYVAQDLAYSTSLNTWYSPLDNDGSAPAKRIIKFDNVDYVCEYTSDFFGRPLSGESYDFSTYPFRIDVSGNMLITQTDGPHTLEISTTCELGTLTINVVGDSQGLGLIINQTSSYNITCYGDTVVGTHTFLLLSGMTYSYMMDFGGATLSYSDLVGCTYDSDDDSILISNTTASLTVTVTG